MVYAEKHAESTAQLEKKKCEAAQLSRVSRHLQIESNDHETTALRYQEGKCCHALIPPRWSRCVRDASHASYYYATDTLPIAPPLDISNNYQHGLGRT